MLSFLSALLSAALAPAAAPVGTADTAASVSPRPASPWSIDFRYAPPWWQTAICLPDDWQKTLVGKEGQLLYDYPGKNSGFKTAIAIGLEGSTVWQRQELVSARVPIVRTLLRQGPVEVTEEAFVVAPPSQSTQSAAKPAAPAEGADRGGPRRRDMLLARFQNTGVESVQIVPTVSIDSDLPVQIDASRKQVLLGGGTHVLTTRLPFEASQPSKGRRLLRFAPITLAGGAEQRLAAGVVQGGDLQPAATSVGQAQGARDEAEKYWEHLDLPYGVFEVPDAGVQALLDSSIRNIYQAREIKKGLPAFQVGPTCYRGLWVVDGSFLMESIAYLGADRGGPQRHSVPLELPAGRRVVHAHRRPLEGDGHRPLGGDAACPAYGRPGLARRSLAEDPTGHGGTSVEHEGRCGRSETAAPNYRLDPRGLQRRRAGRAVCRVHQRLLDAGGHEGGGRRGPLARQDRRGPAVAGRV